MNAIITDHPGEDLLAIGADALVCPVNCIPGVMGKGLAETFAKRFRGLRADHRGYCDHGLLQPGKPAWIGGHKPPGPRYVVLFPTKRHWKDPSRIEDVRDGLTSLAVVANRMDITSIAIPALGCGLGRLDWAQVRLLIIEALAHLHLHVMLFPPHEGAE